MKKFLIASVYFLVIPFAFASTDNPKIDTIQAMYDNESSNFEDYSTQSLRYLLNQASHSDEFWIDYDPTIQGQDRADFQVLALSATDDETVEATILNGGEQSTVEYKMVCDGDSCQIDDIIDQAGSIRDTANSCIK